ncbi:MAG: F0F1 ATP synthase subunit B [Lachnospiraceae bacterium]|jgi:F-type H+-transporting ATPase subunit b|nr:F0F1 ATP synthase subunit B [Lachnospiraceae bacterium]
MLLNNAVLLTVAPQMEPRIFGLDFQLIADMGLTLLSVFVLFFAASYLLFNPVRKMLEDRRERIANELETAAADMKSAAEMKKDYEARLAGVESEVEEILGEARKKGLANESKIVTDAREEAARIVARAQTEAELEKEKAIDELKNDIIDIAAEMAAKAISDQMEVRIQDKLIEDVLKEMGKTTWQS